MKRLLLVVVLVVAGAASVDQLGDLTQSRPDRVVPGSRSELVVEVRSKDYRLGVDQGARNLVAACAGTSGHNVVDQQSLDVSGGGTVRFSVEPALGTHNRRKLVGCLEDATIDRLVGDVVSVETVAPS
ncbi:MAG TPA: hypothetical protein VE623_12835 [Acidimicrobiales bacterium]|jgi:hypothetical protein|nr:hypothetical protein [Acidimicrobiales bacterium]